jgi:beta-glucosidase
MNELHPFRDPDLPLDERIDDLLGRLTLAEKVSLLHQHQPAIPRLGLAPVRTGTEALHGVAWLGRATVFPQVVGMASTWDPELVRRVGSVVGDEARGHHAMDPAVGLNVWAPVVNLLRDPRWGRNEEGWSEDPLLTGVMSTAYARGLAGDDPVHLKTAPTLKHFLAYNNEVDCETTSSNLRPRVLREYELKAFEPAVAAGAATGVMPSYNLVNGRPNHLSPAIDAIVRSWTPRHLMVVSDAFAPSNIAGPQKYYETQPQGHAAALRAGVDSFTDQGADPGLTVESLHTALRLGLLDEADVDSAVRHILAIRFRLGELDPPDRDPWAGITGEVVDAPAHRALAREAARRQLVLLKNEHGTLPLRAPELRRLAVLGPLADTLYRDWYSGTMPYQVTPALGLRRRLGPAAGLVVDEGVDLVAFRTVAAGRYVTAPPGPEGGVLAADADGAGAAQTFAVFDWGEGVVALRALSNGRYVSVGEGDELVNDQELPGGWVVRETFRPLVQPDGSYLLECTATGRYVVVSEADGSLAAAAVAPSGATRFAREAIASGAAAAAAAARDADAAIVVVGNHPMINGRETQDRHDIGLSPAQDRLVRAVHAANPRTVLVVESSYPIAITWADRHVPAIVWSSHGGQEMGDALAEVLLGDHPPSGRLTQTWYRSAGDLPDILEYDIIASDRTYLYFKGTPLYPFGHGLTYTTFRYGNLRLSAGHVEAGGRVEVTVEVTNTGMTAGDEVVQLYTRQLGSRVKQPLRQLRGFRRVHLRPGETTTVGFDLRADDLAHWDVTSGAFVVESAAHEVMVGRSSADILETATLEVGGRSIPPRAMTGRWVEAVDFDDYHRVQLVDETRTQGDAVGATGPGGWILFRDADFGEGVERFTALVAKDDGEPAGIQLCLADPATGPVVGTVTVPVTGDRYAWATASAEVYGAAGVHDLYLVLTGGMRLSRFRFSSPTTQSVDLPTELVPRDSA